MCRLPVTAVHSPGITDFSPRDTLADLHVTFDRSIIKWKCNTLLIICCTSLSDLEDKCGIDLGQRKNAR